MIDHNSLHKTYFYNLVGHCIICTCGEWKSVYKNYYELSLKDIRSEGPKNRSCLVSEDNTRFDLFLFKILNEEELEWACGI